MGRVLLGCSGWQYAAWREVLYPKGRAQRDWLRVYAEHFSPPSRSTRPSTGCPSATPSRAGSTTRGGPLPEPPPTAGFAFVRFHHGARGRRGNSSPTELQAWAPRLRALARGREVFAYFNNDWEGFAVHNALALRKLLGS